MAVQPAPGTAGGSAYEALLGSASEFRISQTMKGCIQEMFGCEANSEFHFLINGEHVGTIEEQSSCCIRLICKNNRYWDTKMVAGQDINAPAILTFHRPFRCIAGGGKCCCYQEVNVAAGPKAEEGGTPLGKAIEGFYCCVPSFKTVTADGTHEYDFHQPTCCGGMMVNCCAQGCCNCRIPFLIYKAGGAESDTIPSSGSTPVPGFENEQPQAQITKVWGGLAQEMFTDADIFELKAPDGAAPDAKARLIAGTLMINQLFFEKKDEDGAGAMAGAM